MTLTVEHLSKRFGSTLAVDDLSFTVRSGHAFALLGGNGAGKTTTIRMILDLFKPDSGSILLNGAPIQKKHIRIGYLPEERGLYPKSKVLEQIGYFGRLLGMKQAAAVAAGKQWLERFGILEHADRKVEELSKGNQQKVQLVVALMNNPDLLILDEPFSGLDPVNSDLLKSVILEQISADKMMIFSSHQMAQVETFCDDICMLKRGKTVLRGNLKEIKKSYGRTRLYLRADEPIDSHLHEFGVEHVEREGDAYKLKIQDEQVATEILQKFVNSGVMLTKFDLLEPSLHEIFIEKVGDGR